MLKFLLLSLVAVAMCELNAYHPDNPARQARQVAANKLVIKAGAFCYIWKAPKRILKGLVANRNRINAAAISFHKIFDKNISESAPVSTDEVPEADTAVTSSRCKGKDSFYVLYLGRA